MIPSFRPHSVRYLYLFQTELLVCNVSVFLFVNFFIFILSKKKIKIFSLINQNLQQHYKVIISYSRQLSSKTNLCKFIV